ncbi:MAG: T9SS type A sorting domain-containing protein [Ignavibacteria bacterium]|nr:T9SS type A sorting domain-containing protein [Ignavibacteria bacterium]
MIDSNTGYGVGESGIIRKTTDSGLNWMPIIPPVINSYGGVSFLNNDTGIAVGPPSNIIQTYNGGMNWIIRNYSGDGLRNIDYVSESRAYAVGLSGIFRSTNGGMNWINVLNVPAANLFFLNNDTGTVVGNQGLILTTTYDAGISWYVRNMNLPVQFGDSSLFDVTFLNYFTGYICGNNGIVVKTTDAGFNWTLLPTGTITAFIGIYFTDNYNGTIVGNAGRILKTTNGGTSWENQISPILDPLDDVDFINQDTGWIVGFNGLIMKTTNGGLTKIYTNTISIPNVFALLQNYPNPFNPNTIINYELAITNFVKLIVYDVLGNEVAVLVNDKQSAGSYSVEFDGSGFASGVYFYKLEAGEFSETKRMVLLK